MLGGHFCDVMIGLITEPLRFFETETDLKQKTFSRWKAQNPMLEQV